jgi:hypothetical protein
MKKCGKCQKLKNFTDFSKSLKKGFQSYCKLCCKQHKQKWITENRDKTKVNALWTKYRLRKDQFDDLLQSQNNKCAICNNTFNETPNVDHDHSCCKNYRSCGNCVRGLLCSRCNEFLGKYEANFHLIDKINQYISNHNLKI